MGSLFSGIGGFDLGLERAGYEIAWQVEIDPYCQRVLAKHWPTVQRYGDIRDMDWGTVRPIDLLCGGFPCQDLSFAGKRAGIDGERSGLWSEYLRAIVQLRPRYVLVENVPGLLSNAYMGRVLRDLAESGYDAEWRVLSAAQYGAPHLRERVWLLAYPTSQLWNGMSTHGIWGDGCSGEKWKSRRQDFGILPLGSRWESYQPSICRTDDGLSSRLDRMKSLGNAIVPQIAEALGRMILASGRGA